MTPVSEFLKIVAAIFAGVLLGLFFFGGLWWTVRRVVVSTNPALFLLSSLLLRLVLVVGGFYGVSHGEWRKLIASLAGFLLARLFVGSHVDSITQARSQMLEGGSN
jgi:F1F0 ATPase subunit 2